MNTRFESLTWHIGAIKITSIIEIDAGDIIRDAIPKATPEEVARIPWLTPHFVDADGSFRAVVQSFVIETAGKMILIDTCVGNAKERLDLAAWSGLQTDFLERFEKLYKREDIDVVLCTHFHFDHVGWNTMRVADAWVPTFPNARYLFAKKEYDYWVTKPAKEIGDDHQGFVDSITPIVDAGLADFVSTNHHITDEVSLIPTPGHTPAHVSVLIDSQGERAIITGDATHHPCQIARPDWETVYDTDAAQGVASRKELLKKAHELDALVIGSHFAAPTAGKLEEDGEGFRLV